jgi:hypothetical protein
MIIISKIKIKIIHEYSMKIKYIFIIDFLYNFYKLIILLFSSYRHVKIIKTYFFIVPLKLTFKIMMSFNYLLKKNSMSFEHVN